ncbi:MAG TPA: ABC transporter ATP-binding protein [Solirubrobacteraceae bacterium]
MSVIELVGVSKSFGDTPVLMDVELTVPAGSITAVLGPSGSGKTTMLRLIAGFERLDSGTIDIGGRLLDDGHRSVRPQYRGVGYVPQDGALFPHLTVGGNIGFGLARGDRSAVGKLLELVGLGGLERRYPHQLSGGQQQRVALARALAIRPSVVLLDEPFSSLDASLRAELGRDVARILADAATTAVLVTHDQSEALALADQIAVLQGGRVVARDDPRALYRDPADLAAATSIGEANVLAAHTEGDQARCALGNVRLHRNGRRYPDGPSRLLLRPEQLMLHLKATGGATRAMVIELRYHGHDGLAHLRLDHPDAETMLVRVPGDLVLLAGQEVWVQATGPGRAWPSSTRPLPAKAE